MADVWGSKDYAAVLALCEVYLRTPEWSDVSQSMVFTPPLTVAEQAILVDLRTMAKFGVTLSLTEWQGIKADAASLKTYLGVATPTLVQTAAATKAIVRVLATIIRS